MMAQYLSDDCCAKTALPDDLGDAALAGMFADFMVDMAGEGDHACLHHTAFLLLEAQKKGDVCLDLKALSQKPWGQFSGLTPDVHTWCEQLLQTPCVAKKGEDAPMILDGHDLYLYRFWHDEKQVCDAIEKRLKDAVELDEAALEAGLERLFQTQSDDVVDWQKVAAAVAVLHRFAVISGGPGTGKTTSLVKVLALLLEQQPNMRIRLAAPTGKAAARMMASIRRAKGDLQVDDAIRQNIPEDACTLHRLLGFSPRGYKHDQDNPVLLDCLVVDEASMVDLSMMARVLAAIPKHARLILLGDRDQLASVDAGNVLGDITGQSPHKERDIVYHHEENQKLAAITHTPLSAMPQADENMPNVINSIALLRKSYRFDASGGIGKLAYSVKQGEVEQAWESLQKGDAVLHQYDEDALGQSLEHSLAHYKAYLQQTDVAVALEMLERNRILCALRQGSWGVEGINQEVRRRLLEKPWMDASKDAHGTPIMIRTNDYERQLFNGDTGLIWKTAKGLQAHFTHVDGEGLKIYPLHMLPAYDPCWAMTVHQSQGSEFEHVALILPPEEQARSVLNRTLFYTAITRAKSTFQVCGSRASIFRAVKTYELRKTGLAKKLGWSMDI